MILFLDTTTDMLCVALCSHKGRILRRKIFERKEQGGNKTFRAIVALLGKNEPEGIIVATGAGRFSGIRHGVTIANTLSFAWGIRAVGIKKNLDEDTTTMIIRGIPLLARVRPMTFVLPSYDREPSITVS
ncbi:MAG: hypothetical protein Q7S16_05065 [bacterium]|nr:hypothetical protein [bacterium]